jgi:uncharacterized protein
MWKPGSGASRWEEIRHEKQSVTSGKPAPDGFDLREVDTYYTRPMSDGWSKRLDVDPLADGQASIDFSIPLAEFPRLTPLLARTEGEVRGHVRFARELGIPVANVEVDCEVELTCQRCFGPMKWPVEGDERVAMVASDTEADRVPEGRETIFAPDHRISLRDLVEEEMLLQLPIVPLHEPADCAEQPSEPAPEREPASENVQRPFERLGELLKRDKE